MSKAEAVRSHRNYGSPRIVRDLRAAQCFVSRRRVARLMGGTIASGGIRRSTT
jgi:hypothetical protein